MSALNRCELEAMFRCRKAQFQICQQSFAYDHCKNFIISSPKYSMGYSLSRFEDIHRLTESAQVNRCHVAIINEELSIAS